MKILNISDYESFINLYRLYEQKKETNDLKNLILLFVASDDPTTKESWCSDCRSSKQIFDKVIKDFQFNDQIALAIIKVGLREEWKNCENPYRNHDLQITAIPTLISLNTGKRLVEGDCNDILKVSHLFSNSL